VHLSLELGRARWMLQNLRVVAYKAKVAAKLTTDPTSKEVARDLASLAREVNVQIEAQRPRRKRKLVK
jgi:hypothetical protein